MTFLHVLYQVLIGPLGLFFELVFAVVNRLLPNPGFTIIVLSLIVNILVLPLYNRADAMQQEERETEERLAPRIAQIKKAFKGDERFMMLQTYYRQNNYSPMHVFKGSFSLLLQVPFFMAAYNLLSGMSLLQGVSFGPIKDLGAPDQMLAVGGITLNVLPILMTIINFIAGFIYLRGMPVKAKVQMYGMAVVFLVLLYNSPAGLAFYWTLNNVFSLFKNLFFKLKNSKLILCITLCICGAALFVYALAVPPKRGSSKITVFLIALSLALIAPMAIRLIGRKIKIRLPKIQPSSVDTKMYMLGCVLMAFLTGLLIPSALIASSPTEFVNIFSMRNPNVYVACSAFSAAGLFLVWFPLFYYLASPVVRRIMSFMSLILTGIFAIDYFCFDTGLGTLSANFVFDEMPTFTSSGLRNNLLVIAGIIVAVILLYRFLPKVTNAAFAAGCLVILAMSVMNIVKINKEYETICNVGTPEIPVVTLSTEGQNVVVIMLDRALSAEVPYIFNEKPELVSQFDGFVYYPNTISHGPFTNFGTPGLFGGYEYIPSAMNERSDMSLKDKHDEALLMMPVLFGENGYQVTVFDPPYAGYQQIPDLSIYDDYDYIDAFNAVEGVNARETQGIADKEAMRERNIFCYSLFRVVPTALKGTIYNNGRYNDLTAETAIGSYEQVRDTLTTSHGVNELFMKNYTLLDVLSNITNIEEGDTDHLFLMDNGATHEPNYLQEPDYVPLMEVDNTEYDAAHPERNVLDGRVMHMDTTTQVAHYDTNMAAYMLLGRWFDYLREVGVYDNTRIIIVADHGRDIGQFDDMVILDGSLDTMWVNPVLMVKDFGATGFTTDNTFMTNADVPTIATSGVISNPVNPFTGNPINSDPKSEDQLVIISENFEPSINNGNQFAPDNWYSVHDDIFSEDNWQYEGNW
jgi:YidC/Oxa1 family membrane protein insertase